MIPGLTALLRSAKETLASFQFLVLTDQMHNKMTQPKTIEERIREIVKKGFWMTDKEVTKAIMEVVEEERRRTIDFMSIDAPVAVKMTLERILKNGHGGGNWRRLVMTELELQNPKPL